MVDITHPMYSNLFSQRVLSKTKITDLTSGFSLADGSPFSLFVIPKADQTAPALVSCKLWYDADYSDCPFVLNDWSPALVKSIEADGVSLDDYDVYVGAAVVIELPES